MSVKSVLKLDSSTNIKNVKYDCSIIDQDVLVECSFNVVKGNKSVNIDYILYRQVIKVKVNNRTIVSTNIFKDTYKTVTTIEKLPEVLLKELKTHIDFKKVKQTNFICAITGDTLKEIEGTKCANCDTWNSYDALDYTNYKCIDCSKTININH